MQPISLQQYLHEGKTEREMDVVLAPEDYKVLDIMGSLSIIYIPAFKYSYVKHKDIETIYTPDKNGFIGKQTIFRIPKYYNSLIFAPADFLPTFYGFETFHPTSPEIKNDDEVQDWLKVLDTTAVKYVLIAKSNCFAIFLLEDETFLTWGCLGDFTCNTLQEAITWLENDHDLKLID